MSVLDDPSMPNWPGEAGHVDYGEGVFVGYRYYDTFGRQVAYPFGYGMTYSTFEIRNLSAIPHDNTVQVSAIVTNTGQVRASEVVQLYVAPCACDAARPAHELKGFEKITLDSGRGQHRHIRARQQVVRLLVRAEERLACGTGHLHH